MPVNSLSDSEFAGVSPWARNEDEMPAATLRGTRKELLTSVFSGSSPLFARAVAGTPAPGPALAPAAVAPDAAAAGAAALPAGAPMAAVLVVVGGTAAAPAAAACSNSLRRLCALFGSIP